MNSQADKTHSEKMSASVLYQTLEAMHRQWRRVLFWNGLARFIIFFILGVLGLCVIDGLFQPVFLIRLCLVCVVMVALGVFIWRTCLRYVIRPYSPQSMAWILESVFPDFHERLISAVELASRGGDKGISEALVVQALSEAEREVQPLSPLAVFPLRWRVFRLPGVLVAGFIIAMLMPYLDPAQRLSRALFPSSRDASLGPNQLALYVGARVRDEGDTVYCRAYVRGGGRDGKPELVVKMTEIRRFVMEAEEGKGWYSFTLPDVAEDFTLWAVAGRLRSKTYTVSVRQRPKIKGIHLLVKSPEYTGVPVDTREGLSGDVRALQGSQVDVRVHSTQKLRRFSVTHDGERISQQTGDLGDWVDFSLRVIKDGHYTISMANVNGLRNQGDLTYAVKSLPDLPPDIYLSAPVKERHVTMAEQVAVFWEAADDYGIDTQSIVLRGANNVVAYQTRVDADRREWSFVPEMLGMKPGMSLFLFVSVFDEAGQSAETEPVKIILGGGELLDDLDVYLTLCDQLEVTLTRIRNELQAVATYTGYLESFDNQAEGDPHYGLMRDRKVDAVRDALQFSQTLTSAMMGRGTFPKSFHYAELLKLYQEQETLFSVPELTKRSSESALKRLNRMVNLQMRMVNALKEKGRQHQWSVLLPLKINSIQSMRMDEDVAAARRNLALTRAELSADFKEQWKHFPEQQTLAAMTIEQIIDVSLSVLQSAARENDRRFNDMRRLDRAATAIEKELRELGKQLRVLADRLKKGGSDSQWSEAGDLAASYVKITASEADPVRRADMTLVADRLTAAIANRNPEGIKDAAEALPVLQVDNRMGQLKNRLKKAQLDGRMLERGLTDSHSLHKEKEKLDALIRLLGDLETESNTLRELNQDDQFETVSQALGQARERLTVGAEALRSGHDISSVAAGISYANAVLETGLEALEKNEGVRRQKADIARADLRQSSVVRSDLLRALSAELYDAGDDLYLSEAPVAAVAEKLALETETLKRVAGTFRDAAARDVVLGRAPPERILEKAALANALDSARGQYVAEARKFLEQAAARLSDNPDQDTQAAADLLMSAGRIVENLARLARFHEQAEHGQLSKQDTDESHAAIIGELTDVLPRNLERALAIEKWFSEIKRAVKDITDSGRAPLVSEKQMSDLKWLFQRVTDDINTSNPDVMEKARRGMGGNGETTPDFNEWHALFAAISDKHDELTEGSFNPFEARAVIPTDADGLIKQTLRRLTDIKELARQAEAVKTELRNLEAESQMLKDQAAETMAAAMAEAPREQLKTLARAGEQFAKSDSSEERGMLLAAAEKEFPGGSDMAANLHKARLGLEKVAAARGEAEDLRTTLTALKRQVGQSIEEVESPFMEVYSRLLDHMRIPLFYLKANVMNELLNSASKNLQALMDTLEQVVVLAERSPLAAPVSPWAFTDDIHPSLFPPQAEDDLPALLEGMRGIMALGDIISQKQSSPGGSHQPTAGNVTEIVEMFENAAGLARKVAVDAVAGTGEPDTGKAAPVFQVSDPAPETVAGFRPWRAAGGGMPARDVKGMVNRYDPYYRDANRAYLEKVNREGRRWID
ncbi:MAG: hypothetical protein RRC34_10200 [Lentisphaeria bacterium]|nr:hypothetical protein [Lentisphaeria bacterium]